MRTRDEAVKAAREAVQLIEELNSGAQVRFCNGSFTNHVRMHKLCLYNYPDALFQNQFGDRDVVGVIVSKLPTDSPAIPTIKRIVQDRHLILFLD